LNDLSEEEQDETLISLSNTPRGELIKAGLSNELISNLKTYGEWTKQATIENIKGGARLEPIEFNEKIYNNELIMTPKGLLPMYTIHQGALIKLDPETGEGEVIDIISDESLIKDERSYGVSRSY